MAGGRRQLLRTDTSSLCELNQPQGLQRVGLEVCVGVSVQQSQVGVRTNTFFGLGGYRRQSVQTPRPGHEMPRSIRLRRPGLDSGFSHD
ncbi:hypothetical protein I553_9208 [Mycobacterium xenopi 4042]|uniref:Uncharacterized protein n=1 Tax=Mycobacterium xenopi 4042 TaxID=1299334 RepID=X8AAG9_MYCXE|nr:hypothetical protein I553_9208 [Mycobacterium xenopi 4042]